MTQNNNLNILPFYSSLDYQNHKKSYAYGDFYNLISNDRKLLPFQIVRPHSANPITFAKVYNIETLVEIDILSELVSAGLNIKEFESLGYDLVINPSALIFPTIKLTDGKYYAEIRDADNTWFSEVFLVAQNTSDFLKIEYWDSENIQYKGGHIDYSAPFKNYCYLITEIGKPEYPFEEEAQQRDGYTFVEKQISEKKYKFTFLAPEFLCDALRIVRMHDYVNIYSKGIKYSVENIIFDPKWQTQGNLATVEAEFECDTVIKKIGKGLSSIPLGDFNEDFNNDFNI
jgi:hypothetical protein